MDRRIFLRNSIVGLGGLYGLAGSECESMTDGETRQDPPTAAGRLSEGELFRADIKSGEWAQFSAAGFSQPVCGVVYKKGHDVLNGMPLGGVATGFLDVETDGTFGLCSLFNSGVPVQDWLHAPFLGLSVGDQTWVLTTREMLRANSATDIHYWGHYPVVDLEYQTTAPVSAALRAWVPFFPGDAHASNIPAAVFEVHLRNRSTSVQKGTLAFNFPGPTQAEAQIAPDSPRIKRTWGWPINESVTDGVVLARRTEVNEAGLQGLSVSSEKGTSYLLGTITQEENLRFGGPLFFNAYDAVSDSLWRSIGHNLPRASDGEFGTSMSMSFALAPGETKVIRIVLAWHSPIWKGEGSHFYKRMYARRHSDALSVARLIARDHQALLSRILAWQQTLYTETDIPVWLRDSLVNIFHLFAKTGYWAQASAPIGDWCNEETGLFAMSECPRECPNIECLPCSFYGNIPLVYFFPELALSTLRGYKAYQSPEGASAMLFGGASGGTDGAELAAPGGYDYQTTLNGPCYVDMVDRYWQRTGDDQFLKEFYTSAKKSTVYTMKLGSGPYGIVSMPKDNMNPEVDLPEHDAKKSHSRGKPGYHLDWFEEILWFGMTPHVGGIHLAQLRMAQRMAEKVGDSEFLGQCKEWIRQGSDAIENQLWTGQYYLAYRDPATDEKSDLVFGYQLDGDWMCFFHGLPGVFRPERARLALETIKRTCMRMSTYGPVNFTQPDGSRAPNSVGYGSLAFFPPEVWMLASTFMYQGQRELGVQVAHDCVQNLVRRGYTWTQPNIIDAETGKRVYGSDYYQNLMLWALPAAIAGKDIAQSTAHGSLVDRVIRAAAKV